MTWGCRVRAAAVLVPYHRTGFPPADRFSRNPGPDAASVRHRTEERARCAADRTAASGVPRVAIPRRKQSHIPILLALDNLVHFGDSSIPSVRFVSRPRSRPSGLPTAYTDTPTAALPSGLARSVPRGPVGC